MSWEQSRAGISRRSVLRTLLAGAAASRWPAAGLAGVASTAAVAGCSSPHDPAGTRVWVGRDFWANRLQDWRHAGGRLECVGDKPFGRSLSLLTAELGPGAEAATITVRNGTLASGSGFAAVLLGTAPDAAYPARALVQAASGTGGGLMCTHESDGRVRFRDHSDEGDQFGYAVLPAAAETWSGRPRAAGDTADLRIDLAPQPGGRYHITATATDAKSGGPLASAVLRNVPAARLRGGVSLFSTEFPKGGGARYWFAGLSVTGAKARHRPERAVGPVLGTLWSLSGGTLKLSAQLLPVGADDPQTVRLDHRLPGGAWRTGPVARLGPGYSAVFRVPGWDASRDTPYRVVYADGTDIAGEYHGTVRRDPIAADVVSIAVINCSIHSFRPLDDTSQLLGRLRGERPLGLYTSANLYFPYADVTAGIRQTRPDLLAVLGDQFYENRPTAADRSAAPVLDYLYRWYLWLWAFRDLTRDLPAIVLVDDHDVYQPNLWGHGGQPAPHGDFAEGGYVHDPSWLNLVQRVQCGHNPDPYDPAPADRGITVYYGTMRFGGVSLAWVEDRKFKSGGKGGRAAAATPDTQATLNLLGARQEAFLQAWSRMDPGLPKVCLTQTPWACVKTTANGTMRRDPDSGGYPPAARDRALRLIKQAGAVLLSGDQHLATLIRHGLNGFTDGPVQFTSPAVGTAWQRWFTPATALAHPDATPNTGDVTDAYGNRLHVLAVANPRVPFATYRAAYPGTRQEIGDRHLKSEGYGVLRIDKAARTFHFECWPYNARPAAPTGQYPGWPVRLKWADA